jgi:hypothetical protein
MKVPEIEEPLPWLDSADGQALVTEIVHNVTCDVADGLYKIHAEGKENPGGNFLATWGVQITLTLTIDEKSALAPGLKFTPPEPFSLGFGENLSTDATRIDKLSYFYTVKDLTAAGKCTQRSQGKFLLSSDLKLGQWLHDATALQSLSETKFPSDDPMSKDVISHEVKFDIVSSGSVTPMWMLHRVTVNGGSGNTLSASRDRTHDLLITLGPAQPVSPPGEGGDGKAKQMFKPSEAAANAHLASEIGLAVANSLRGVTITSP